MSVARRHTSGRALPGFALFVERLIVAGERLIAETREGVLVAGALGCFAVLWMLYDTITLAPGSYNPAPLVVNGVCDVSNTLNWGDGVNHAQPCGGYYPLVHITGSATVTGTGQGILLIDGDLSLGGNLQWFGALIVQGALKAAGGGGKLSTNVWRIALIHGGVDLAGVSKFSGTVNFQYSKCGLTQALNGTSTVAVSRSRAWSQLY